MKRKKVWNASLLGLLILLVMGMSVFYFPTSDIKANSVSSFEVEEDPLKDEEIRFSIDVGEYLEVKKDESFSIEVTTNQTIDSLRIIVPKDAEFSFSDEKVRTHIQTYEDESSLWLVEFNQKNDSFPATLSVLESGQVSVEDAAGEIHSAFLYVNIGIVSRNGIELNEANARTSVNVSTWANFRSAWNNNARTAIILINDIPLGTSSLNTRSSAVTVEGATLATLTSTTGQTLAWASGVTVNAQRIIITGFNMNGGVLNLGSNGTVRLVSGTISLDTVNTDTASRLENTGGGVINLGTMNVNGGFVETVIPIKIGTLNLLNNRFSIRNNILGRAIDANEVNISNGLMSWDLDNNTYRADRGWENLQAVVRNNSIISSSDSTFNDQSFQLANSSWIRGYGASGDGGQAPNPSPQEYELSLLAIPSEGGRPTASATTLGQGGTTTLTANPNSGYSFVRWEIVSGTGATIANPSSASTIFTMGSSNAIVRAVYELNGTEPVDPPDPEPNPEGLTVVASPANGGSPHFVIQGSILGVLSHNLYANTNPGFRFIRWELISGTGGLIQENSEEASFLLTSNAATVRAVYEPITHDLKLEAIPISGGAPKAESTSIAHGEKTTITANPNAGYVFKRWEIVSGTGSSISDENNENATFTMGSADTRLSAIYEQSDAFLIVEFINELGDLLPNYTVTIDAKLGDEIDLTTEAGVIAQLDFLTENGYEIIERPANEAAIKLIDTEMTVQYKIKEYQGTVSLTSVPNNFDFGTITYDATTKRIEAPAVDKPLVVTDSRTNAIDGWALTASLSTPMENSEGQVLIDALRYVYNEKEMILDANAQTVYLSNERVAGSFDVSESWGAHPNTDGLKLQINSSDTIHTGDYVGVITWKVMAGQP